MAEICRKMPEAFRQLQGQMLRKPGADREMVEFLSLVLHHEEQAALWKWRWRRACRQKPMS